MGSKFFEQLLLAFFPVYLIYACGMTLAEGAQTSALLAIYFVMSHMRDMYKRKEEKVK